MLKTKKHKIALKIAQQYGLEKDYLKARHWGLSPKEALEEFDIPTDAMTNINVCKHTQRK